MIELLKKELGSHFWNHIKIVNSYKDLPKSFKFLITPNNWDYYSKYGQFFLINLPPKKYLVLLFNGVENPLEKNERIQIMDEKGRDINQYDLEGQLRIAYFGLRIQDILTYYMKEKVNKINESDINRLVKKILKNDNHSLLENDISIWDVTLMDGLEDEDFSYE